MSRYLARRLVMFVPVLLGVTLVTFLVLHLIPGNPARILLFGTNPTAAQVRQLTDELGLNRPLPVQYGVYLTDLVRGNLGQSYSTDSPVVSDIAQRLPSTMALAGAGMAVATLVGVPLGVLAGLRPGSLLDRLATSASVVGMAVPYFWLAFLLILLFAVKLGWLPSLGTGSPQAIVLPALALGLGFSAILTRLMRASLVEVYAQPYIELARSLGLSRRAVLWRHALRNAVLPVVVVLGIEFGTMVSGAVVIEQIFSRPGLGSFIVTAISNKDIPAVQGSVLVVAVFYLVVNLAVDMLHGVLDPRVRRAWQRR
ncbi:MAG TPA: ABC transporter permease [Acidimicrobiales bacterium]|nr:ABC transporter permease [Acidimicrobiales bacterium]